MSTVEQHPREAVDSTTAAGSPLVSVVIPCLNEVDHIYECVTRAFRALEGAAIEGEVIVADNGSTDGSADVARDAGAASSTSPGVVTGARISRGSPLRAAPTS